MRARTIAYVAALAALWLVATAAPASAQQLVDSSTNGGRAFIGLALMCFAFIGILFAFDKIRERHDDDSQQ
jgi:hypothetical protein